MNKHKPTLFLFVLLLISGNTIFAVKTPALLQSIRLPKTIPGKEWGTSLWNKVPNMPSNDAVMRYIWKKTPVRMRTAIENYIQKHPTRYKKAQEVAKKAYPYRYYLMGGLGLLALARYNRGLVAARFNRTQRQPEVFTMFTDEQLAERRRTIEAQKNSMQENLFCYLMNQFDAKKDNLNLNVSRVQVLPFDTITQVSSLPDFIKNVLEPFRAHDPIICKRMHLKKESKDKQPDLLTVDDYQEDGYFSSGTIFIYYNSINNILTRTILDSCPGKKISELRSDERLFEAIAYRIIKAIATVSFFLDDFRGQLRDDLVLDYEFGSDIHKEFGLVRKDNDHLFYNGQNKVGKMILFILNCLRQPEVEVYLEEVKKQAMQWLE